MYICIYRPASALVTKKALASWDSFVMPNSDHSQATGPCTQKQLVGQVNKANV